MGVYPNMPFRREMTSPGTVTEKKDDRDTKVPIKFKKS